MSKQQENTNNIQKWNLLSPFQHKLEGLAKYTQETQPQQTKTKMRKMTKLDNIGYMYVIPTTLQKEKSSQMQQVVKYN